MSYAPDVIALATVFAERGYRYTRLADLVAAVPKDAKPRVEHLGVNGCALRVLDAGFGTFPMVQPPEIPSDSGLDLIVQATRNVAHSMATDTVVQATLELIHIEDIAGGPRPFERWTHIVQAALTEAVGNGDIPEPHPDAALTIVTAFSGLKEGLRGSGAIARLPRHAELFLRGVLAGLGVTQERMKELL